MERSLNKLIFNGSEVPSAKTSGIERNAWEIPLGTAAHHASTDASLFSSSLPVLPHAKLNFAESENYGQSIDDSSPSLSRLHLEDEMKDPLEEEPSRDRCLLPGDEDELLAGIMDDFDLSGLPTQLEDLEDDFFGSGGGLELEPDAPQDNSLNGFAKLSLSDGILGSIVGLHVFPNGAGTVAGEHPYGEHPSRTLFVRNINSNVEDSELQSLFEQYGDIRTLYTACKHRGFVMISYYDIRAARTAMRTLQNKPLRRRKLDIHFSIPKENPSEKDINQGTLVIFNLDPSVSNEDLRQIFGAYGEVKEIRETPHKRHHKFIEFYDVRAAEAALKALNRSDIAGKRIKLEPSRPGGARRNLMQQLGQDYEHEEVRTFRHSVGSPVASSPPGSWSNFGSPVEPNSLLGYNQSPSLRNLSPVNANHMPGLASILPGHLSSPKITPIGKDPRRLGHLNQAITSPKSVQGVGYQHSHSVPEHIPRLNMGSMSFGESKSSGIGMLSGPQFLWGSPPIQSEHTDSSVWSTSSMTHPFASNGQGQGHGYPYPRRQGLFLGSHHVGSAPSGIPLDRHLGLFSESPETSYMHQVAYGSPGSSHNNGSHVMSIGGLGAMNMGVSLAGNFTESGSPSPRMMPLARNGHLLFGNGSYRGIGMANSEGLTERGRSRGVETGNEIDNKKQYQLDLNLVMSEFYHTTQKEKRPSVFGMTASPVNLKGVSSQVDCAIKIRNLETKLDSVVFTIKDRKDLEKHVPMPSEVVVEYDKAASLWSLHEQIKQMESAVEEAAQSSSRRSKWQFMGARDAGAREELRQVYGVSERTESDGAANLIQKLRAINYALGELGQWCAYKVARSFLTALQNDERASYQLDVKFQESYLDKVVSLLQCQLSEGAVAENGKMDEGNNPNSDCDRPDEMEEGELLESHVVSSGEHVDVTLGAAVADGKVTPKVQSLIKILLKYQHTEDFRAIIFVERVVTALVLPKVFEELPSLSFITSSSLIGHNNSQEMRTGQMQDTIAKFRDGRMNLLVATSVAEEGLDIRQCNVVIRFDLAKTILAYIQSRGRARKPGSDYILMVERDNLSHEAFLRNARNSEETLRKEAIERTDISHLKGASKLISGEAPTDSVYQVESTGAVVSLNSAVGLIHFYCSQLPSDRYSILRPEFIMERHEKPGGPTEYSCRLQLPCNAPFEKLEGPVCSSMRLAQQAVCLDACKKLHQMGAFTDMLLPDKGSGAELEKAEQEDEGDPIPGTSRHREFYPEGVADILKGEWILSGKDSCDSSKLVHLYMYAIKCVNIGTSKDPFLTDVSEFAILFGNELDAEVLSMSMDLFIARTVETKATLVFRGPIEVTESQLASLKSFHVRMMSIVLDVDVEPSTTPWDPAKAYLFAPVTGDESGDPIKDINWDLIKKITKTDVWSNPLQKARPDVYLGTSERALGGDRREYGFAKLRHGMAFGLKSHPTYGVRGAIANFDVVKASGLVPHRSSLDLVEVDSSKDKIMMADCCLRAEDIVGRIVTAAHSGKRFYVDCIPNDMTAENSFPRKEGYLGPLEYSSYAAYYKQKYGVDLVYKKQPLLRGRGVSYCKNLLSPRFEHSEEHEGELEEATDKTYYVFLPPELCFLHPLPGSLVRGAQRLPSIMRRVESMLLAVQLKDMIGYPVPALKILEALTAASCQETFCYERAELLGDAYLKWVVSRYLFLKYPQKHEGQLTRMRQQLVSNMVLYQYALNKGLQSYIQADRFSPSRWAAPGVLPVYDEDTNEEELSIFGHEITENGTVAAKTLAADEFEDEEAEEGELDTDSGSYRVLSSKTMADVVESLIGVYYVDGGKYAANHFMKWIGVEVDFDFKETEYSIRPYSIPENVLRSVDFDKLQGALNISFNDKGLLLEAITHASRPSSGVSCYQRLEFVGDAVLDHLITRHLFFTYTDLPPGRLTDLRAAAVNNENFARVAVKHSLHLHLRHGSSALEKQIRDFVSEVKNELSKPGFNSFGLGDCKAPKVLGDIFESIAGAIFLDSGCDTAAVWKVFQPLLHPMVTPETLPMHPVRELQERCQQQAQGLEYKASRSGNIATVEVYVDGIQVGMAQNPQKKMAQKLAARNALVVLKEREEAEAKKAEDGKKKKNGNPSYTRQTLNDICLRRNWPMPLYRSVHEGGPAHAKRFTYGVRVNTSDKGWTDECIGEPMPSVKKAKDSAASLLLELLNRWYS